MNHNKPRPPATPTAIPTPSCRANCPAMAGNAARSMPPAASNATIKAIPTGSFAPDSPSRMSPLRPAISRRPSTEKTTAGSVGDTAVPSRAARYQSSPKARWASTEAAAAVRNVPTIPSTAIGVADRRKRGHPRCIPPSNKMHSRATVTTRSTICSAGGDRPGNTLTAMAAAARNRTGAGTCTRSVRPLDSTASNPTMAVSNTTPANAWVSPTGQALPTARVVATRPWATVVLGDCYLITGWLVPAGRTVPEPIDAAASCHWATGSASDLPAR